MDNKRNFHVPPSYFADNRVDRPDQLRVQREGVIGLMEEQSSVYGNLPINIRNTNSHTKYSQLKTLVEFHINQFMGLQETLFKVIAENHTLGTVGLLWSHIEVIHNSFQVASQEYFNILHRTC